MGLFDALRKQFIDVLQWDETTAGELAWRYPMEDNEIQNGASLTVREGQAAVFVDEGKLADVFGPGRHTLTTSTLPVLTNLRHWDKLHESPFKSDVYFINTRDQLDRRWGTATPITFRDKEFGPIRLRAFGTYSYRITDPATFHTSISGSVPSYSVEQLDAQLKAEIVTDMTAFLASAQVPFLDMAANIQAFSDHVRAALQPDFAKYGLTLQMFAVQSLSLPEALQEALDKRAQVAMVGNLQQFTQFQVANAIPDAAKNEGGMAGAGVGMGAGVAFGQAMTSAMGGAGAAVAGGSTGGEDPYAKLEKLHGLLQKGIITQDDFDKQKARLLDQL